jgi:hypothetical protein
MHTAIKRWLMTLPKWKLQLALACAVGLLGWLSVLVSSSGPAQNADAERAPGSAPGTGTPLQPRMTANGPASPAPSAPSVGAPTASRDDALAALREGLASDNSGTRIEALRAVRDDARVAALPELLARDVARDPEVAPTLIAVAAELARKAEPAQRTAATQKLSEWLRSESAREGADARGNVAQLVEALGAMNTPEAVPALVEALDRDQLPLHVETVVVEGLAQLGDPSARAAVEQFRARLAAAPAPKGFELELHHEAEIAADRALARLSK